MKERSALSVCLGCGTDEQMAAALADPVNGRYYLCLACAERSREMEAGHLFDAHGIMVGNTMPAMEARILHRAEHVEKRQNHTHQKPMTN